MKKKHLLIIFLSLLANLINGQSNLTAHPHHWKNAILHTAAAEAHVLAPINLTKLRYEDSIESFHKDIPYRFAYVHEVELNTHNSGTWIETKNHNIWRLKVKSSGAYSLNFTFDQFHLSPGASVYIYNNSENYFLGPFTAKDNRLDSIFSTVPYRGDECIIELKQPKSEASILQVATVAHDYKNLFKVAKDFRDSQTCNINVICPQGTPWQDQIKSVALMTLANGSRFCTGSLINNTASDGTPYFLTADHCISNGFATWNFIFNYESSSCNTSLDGPLTNVVNGASLKASNPNSDFALLELASAPPASYGVYYAGWDKSDNIPSNQTGIHHPSGDVKKISLDTDPSNKAVLSGVDSWQVTWNQGTTEGGSSGSPLFDQNKRVIGQLLGGNASCNNPNGSDYYGRLGVSWEGNSPTSRLKDWLDPSNSNVAAIDGYDPNAVNLPLEIALTQVTGVETANCGVTITPEVLVKNLGSSNVTSFKVELIINGTLVNTTNWTGNLSTGSTATESLGTYTLSTANNAVLIQISKPNGSTDGNSANNSFTQNVVANMNPASVDITLVLDDYGSETAWELEENGTVIYQGGPYSDNQNGVALTGSFCLSANSCYEFTIYDSEGDGICCGFGNGSYSLVEGAITHVAGDGQFVFSKTHQFCTGATSIRDLDVPTTKVYPNPTAGDLFIASEEPIQAKDVTLFNSIGAQVPLQTIVHQISSTELKINTTQLSKGVYFIQVGKTRNSVVVQ